jgi:acetyl-CoA synthetase
VSEAAAISIPDDIKGHVIYAYVVLKLDIKSSNDLKNQLVNTVREIIGPIAIIAQIQWAKELPKTRSGKIMRRILQKIAIDEYHELGDMSTLANPSVVDDLIRIRKKMSL